jgi:hypothetical protein
MPVIELGSSSRRSPFREGDTLRRACQKSLKIARDDFSRYSAKKKSYNRYTARWQRGKLEDHRSGMSQGEKNLKNLVEMLNRGDKVGFRRSAQQIQFHKAFISACLSKIMNGEVSSTVVRIMKEYGLDELRNDVIVCKCFFIS